MTDKATKMVDSVVEAQARVDVRYPDTLIEYAKAYGLLARYIDGLEQGFTGDLSKFQRQLDPNYTDPEAF